MCNSAGYENERPLRTLEPLLAHADAHYTFDDIEEIILGVRMSSGPLSSCSSHHSDTEYRDWVSSSSALNTAEIRPIGYARPCPGARTMVFRGVTLDLLIRYSPRAIRVAAAGGTDYSVVLVGSSSALRFLRRLRLARTVEGDRLANERLEGGRGDLLSFRDVDRAAYVSVEARVEETGRILQGRTLREGELHDLLVGFAGADETVVRPDRSAPFPLLDDF